MARLPRATGPGGFPPGPEPVHHLGGQGSEVGGGHHGLWRGVGLGAFWFDEQGRLADITAERFDNARKAILPWSTPISDYGQFAGIRVPVEGAGVWHYEQGAFPYIRLRVIDLEHNRPEPYKGL